MFNEATFNEAMFNDASHIMGEDLSKRCLIDDDVLNLLYCKTSSSTEFENERDFFWHHNGSIFKRKNPSKIPKLLTTLPLD